MIVPEKDKGVKSFRIPGLFFRSFVVIVVLASIFIGILAYDYWNVVTQVYENKHLNLENRQLKEQIQLFQMKINSLADDLHRINTFERKLRIITGLEDVTEMAPIVPASNNNDFEMMDDNGPDSKTVDSPSSGVKRFPLSVDVNFDQFEHDPDYLELKSLYDKKIAANLGITENYAFTRKWSDLTKNSFELARQYSIFDFKFKKIKSVVNQLELNIHKLDQFLLDKASILASTPTILPSNGWITSYFGHRISPFSGGVKMHEGLDVGAPFGTPIMASADGIVTFSGIKAGFGNFVQINHGYGIETIYAHAQKTLVKKGQRVKRGDLVAKVGSTGYSTGPHLHYEVRVNGIAVDPLYFVLSK